ncbi:MAG: hypothetical protein IJK52_13265 [Oscillospiraceae bacterium]|nr:hypothetical protein [Oscillospiraceae bacterium]
MQRMRTIKQAMEHVRSVDPETALTEYALRRMVTSKVIPSTRIGTKYLLSLDILDEFLKSAEDVPTVPEAPPIGGIRKINVAL